MGLNGVVAILILSLSLGAVPAVADQICTVPLADWQPRQALQKKLEAEGWTVVSIRSDDGCYKVKATKAGGARLKIKYDPASLEPVQKELETDRD